MTLMRRERANVVRNPEHKPHSAQLLRLRPQGHRTDRRRRELSEEDYRTVIGKQESLGQRCDGVRSGVQETDTRRRGRALPGEQRNTTVSQASCFKT